jgi:cellulose synthase/poly-beta-1,6-N-acetylglucosamine synthase-like glycosyltransferase
MKISILVPLYNEEEVVANMLERAIAAPLPVGFEREIIVADDGSTDDSVLEVEAVVERSLCANMTETPCVTAISEQGGKEKTQHDNGKWFCSARDTGNACVRFGIG